MDNTIFLVWNKSDYFYSMEPRCMRPCHMPSSRTRVIGEICRTLHMETIPESFIPEAVKHAERIVMTDVIYDPCLYKTLKKYCGSENIFLYYMNLIGTNNKEYMHDFQGRIYSFDKEDAKRFGICYKHLPYSDKVKISSETFRYDTVFLGVEKGRTAEVRKAACILESCGLKAKLMVLNGSDPKYKIKSYIPYSKYLQYVSESRSILEINVPGQSSCTLRFLESLFLKKKLITTNQYIVTDPYYDPDNVFILGVDDLCELPDFVAQPYKDQHLDLSELSFETWIQDWQE